MTGGGRGFKVRDLNARVVSNLIYVRDLKYNFSTLKLKVSSVYLEQRAMLIDIV